MRGLTRTLLVGALVLAMMAMVAAPAGAKKGGTDRPFMASAYGSNDVPLETCDFTNLPIVVCEQFIDTTVIGTHIGEGTGDGEGPTIVDTSPAADCVLPGGEIGDPFMSDIDAVITAANGDELYVNTPVEGCFAYGVEAVYTAQFTIEGGTGRFEGATGGGTVVSNVGARLPGFAGEISQTWTGTISY